MKIKLVYPLLVCSLFLVSSCGVKGPLYHEKTEVAPKVEKKEKTEVKTEVKTPETSVEEKK